MHIYLFIVPITSGYSVLFALFFARSPANISIFLEYTASRLHFCSEKQLSGRFFARTAAFLLLNFNAEFNSLY